MVQAAKAFLEHQGKPSQSFVMDSFKEKRKFKALVTDLRKTGTKRAFKSKKIVEINSNKEGKERVCTIKKIKCKHVEEPTGT
ncbi:hypothetical protein C0995_007303 [Termitomyces sp. Mi166|nr:hypothetical protein C0995_007303 [Termitomyces sp. Mi166\